MTKKGKKLTAIGDKLSNMAGKRDRISIDLQGLRRRIERHAIDENESLGAIVRRLLVYAMESLESKDENPPPPSIAQLVARRHAAELATETGITRARLEAIARGAEPLFSELALLAEPLEMPVEELMQIYKMDFPMPQPKQKSKSTAKKGEAKSSGS